MLPTLGKGSLQNLSDILYLRGVDIGFVQADALTYAKQHNMFPGLTQNIRYIAKLYDEEVHVLVRKDITRLEDLNGQRVNVDVTGSGSAMTAEILLDAYGIKAKVEHEKQVTGVQELKRGDIAAIIHVGGAPIPLFADVPADSGIHFLPLALNPTLAQTYLPDQFTHDTYPLLVPADAPVPTIAVGDVMAVFGWAPQTDAIQQGRPLRGRLLQQVRSVSAAATPSQVARSEPDRGSARLDPLPACAGLAGAAHHGGHRRNRDASAVQRLPVADPSRDEQCADRRREGGAVPAVPRVGQAAVGGALTVPPRCSRRPLSLQTDA